MKITSLLYQLFKFFNTRYKSELIQSIIWYIITNFPEKIIKKSKYIYEMRKFFTIKVKILMYKQEIEIIKSNLKPNDVTLEWGSGGSTLFFPKYVKKYYSIEHSFPWYYKIKKRVPKNVSIKFIRSNAPISNPSKRKQLKDYIEIVHKLNVPIFNKVLIDGRGRQWCAKEVLNYLDEDSVVFIHDFDSRPRYQSVFTYYAEIDHVRKLIVLKKKSESFK